MKQFDLGVYLKGNQGYWELIKYEPKLPELYPFFDLTIDSPFGHMSSDSILQWYYDEEN